MTLRKRFPLAQLTRALPPSTKPSERYPPVHFRPIQHFQNIPYSSRQMQKIHIETSSSHNNTSVPTMVPNIHQNISQTFPSFKILQNKDASLHNHRSLQTNSISFPKLEIHTHQLTPYRLFERYCSSPPPLFININKYYETVFLAPYISSQIKINRGWHVGFRNYHFSMDNGLYIFMKGHGSCDAIARIGLERWKTCFSVKGIMYKDVPRYWETESIN